MLRATPGFLRIKPARSRVSIIWWTDGGGDAEIALQVTLGRRTFVDLAIGPDEGEVLALLFGEAGWRCQLPVK